MSQKKMYKTITGPSTVKKNKASIHVIAEDIKFQSFIL